ncbi:HprK-related kinase B [Desulfoplanes sp.]
MSDTTMTCSELIRDFRKNHPVNTSLAVKLGGLVIDVTTNSFKLNHNLQDYFQEFMVHGRPADIQITVHEAEAPALDLDFSVKEPEPGKSKIKEEWVDLVDGRIVRKRITGMHFIFTRDEHLAIGPCEVNPNQVINFINNRFIEYKLQQGCLLGHAAGVRTRDRGMAMAGFSGMGKSTLALHIMNRGTDFVSNDRVIVENLFKGPRFYGVAKHPRINPGTALNNPNLAGIVTEEDKKRFQAMSTDELWSLEYKYDALIDECYGPGRFTLEAPLDAVVILNWQRNDEPTRISTVKLMDRQDLLPAFMKSRGLFYLPLYDQEEPGIEDYISCLRGCTIIEISGGVDFDKAARACMAFLESGQVISAA